MFLARQRPAPIGRKPRETLTRHGDHAWDDAMAFKLGHKVDGGPSEAAMIA